LASDGFKLRLNHLKFDLFNFNFHKLILYSKFFPAMFGDGEINEKLLRDFDNFICCGEFECFACDIVEVCVEVIIFLVDLRHGVVMV